jgi:CheY-like chemotaxis protein
MARILLVDDDSATRNLLARALTSDGHTVSIAADGQEAHDRITSDPRSFDVLVADVQMPLMDGVELAERVLAAVPHVRIALMSALAGELGRAERLRTEGVRLLAKPMSLDQIRAEVRGLLG